MVSCVCVPRGMPLTHLSHALAVRLVAHTMFPVDRAPDSPVQAEPMASLEIAESLAVITARFDPEWAALERLHSSPTVNNQIITPPPSTVPPTSAGTAADDRK